MKTLTHLITRAHHLLWSDALAGAPGWRRGLIQVLRMVYAVMRDAIHGQLTLRAMSLVYTTLLSLVPLLALSFSVLKAFGVHNKVRPTLQALLEPLGPKGMEITNQVIGFVDNIKVGVLGALGLGMLVYTVISLLQKIEGAFNHVWHVQRPRPLAQRFSQYLSVLLIGPLLIFSAMGVTAAFFGSSTVKTLVAIQPLGMLFELVATLLPFVFVIAAFAFVYMVMPNTRVRLGSALVGATVAGILWQALGWGFAAFVVGSAQYTAIYAGFAIVIFSMIWLYLNWLIILVGASIACYYQYPSLLATPRGEVRLSHRVRERIALLVATYIGRNYYNNAPALSLEALAERIGVPTMSIESVLTVLRTAGYIAETADDPPLYVPARAFETITVRDLLNVLRAADEEAGLRAASLPRETEVETLLARADSAMESALRDSNLRELTTTTKELAGHDRPG